ncbi:MAG: HD domain-containing protein [Planctomycetota bacterium]|jgi:hypothetical protein
MTHIESWIETASGKAFWYDNVEPDVIEPCDVIHSLSQQCRYLGHCARFYSVAEHTCHVVDLLPDQLKLFGILHDWSEAYTGDLPKPMKLLLPKYSEIEEKIQNAIYTKFAGRLPTPDEHHEIKRADLMSLKAEVLALSHSLGYTWGSWFQDIPAPEFRVHCWDCEKAKNELFDRWLTIEGE